MSLPTLYKLSADYQTLLHLQDEVPDQVLADTLEALAGDIEVKGVNIVKVAKSILAVSEARRNAGKELIAAAEREERHAQRLLDYLEAHMKLTGITKISCEYFTARLRTNPPSVKIAESVLLPDEYMVHKPAPPPAPDKVKIKADLKAGKTIDGCWLESAQRLEIKP